MEKLTSDLYSWFIRTDSRGTEATLCHRENRNQIIFFMAGLTTDAHHNRVASHMHSLTDSQCHQWLDPVRAEEEKRLAKEEAKQERLRLQALAQKEREDKLAKKEENKRKQREALQRKQETEGS